MKWLLNTILIGHCPKEPEPYPEHIVAAINVLAEAVEKAGWKMSDFLPEPEDYETPQAQYPQMPEF